MPYQENDISAPDGLSLFQRIWLPEQQPDAVLMIVHGIVEHSGR